MAVNLQHMQTLAFEVYASGNRLLGLASVDLPEINFATTEVKGAGLAGTFEVPARGHTENLELTLHWRAIFETPLRLFRGSSIMLSLRGAIETYDAATGDLKAKAIRIDVRGLPASLSLGKFEPAETMDSELKINLDYISVKVNGATLLEIDKENYVYSIDSENVIGDVKNALGL